MKKNPLAEATEKMPRPAIAAPTADELKTLVTLYNQRCYVDAENSARDLIQRFPEHGFGWKVLGAVLQMQGLIDDSLAAKQKAADLSPNDAEAYSNLGNAYQEQNRLEEAEQCLRHALKISPNLEVAHNNLGLTLQKLNRLDEAQACYQKALALQPDFAQAHYNYGITLQKLERFEQAENSYRQAIAVEPNYANAHYNLALLLMLTGRFQEAWAQYQWLYHPHSTNPSKPKYPNLPAKQWQGEPLQGKTILIHSEQGLGDMLQFVRYAQHLQAAGAKVWMSAAEPLVAIFKTVPWLEGVIGSGEPLPVAYDFWVFPLALPFWFQTTLATVPVNLPYLSVDKAKSAWWEAWLSKQLPTGNKRVGLVWAGNPLHQNDAGRSIGLAQFAVLAGLNNISFVSLQLGDKAGADIAANAEKLTILNASLFIRDFTDSAALLSCLDLLLTVDSAPAHLAGALDLPVWTLLTKVPDWRWLLGRSDSVWYKSMRLFRQSESGDWEGVLIEVKSALAAL